MRRPAALKLEPLLRLPILLSDHPRGFRAQWPGRNAGYISADQPALNPWLAALLDLARWQQQPSAEDESRFWAWLHRPDWAPHARLELTRLGYPLLCRDQRPLETWNTYVQALLETYQSPLERGLALRDLYQLEQRPEWYAELLRCADRASETSEKLRLLYQAAALAPHDGRALESAREVIDNDSSSPAHQVEERREEHQQIAAYLSPPKKSGSKRLKTS